MYRGKKIPMRQDSLEQHRRYMTLAYVFLFLALFTIVSLFISYFLARQVAKVDHAEVWIQAQAFWVMRNAVLYSLLVIFAALWFIPLAFFPWDSFLWVKACTVLGVIFSSIAWLYLLNAWFKGFSRYIRQKAVF